MSGSNSYLTFDISALILCDDSHFLGSLERVFAKLGGKEANALPTTRPP